MVDSLILFLTQAVPPAVFFIIYMALAMLACAGSCRLIFALFGPCWTLLDVLARPDLNFGLLFVFGILSLEFCLEFCFGVLEFVFLVVFFFF